MANIANEYDPNDPNKQPNTGGGGDVMQTGGSSGGADTSSGGGATPSAPAPYSPPNVQQYLNANQGAGEQLSGAIQNNVQNQANQVNQGVQNTQNQLQKQSEPLEQNLNQGQAVANTAFKDPVKLLADYNAAKTQSSSQPLQQPEQQAALNQYNQFQQNATGGYNPAIQSYGTTAQQGFNPLEQQSANIQQQANAATNEMGRNQLLQQTVAHPYYSQGQQTLDSLFLQGQGNQLKQGLGGIASQVGQNVSGANASAQAKLQALQGMSGQNQEYIKNLFTQGNPNQQGMGLNQIGENVKTEYTAAQGKEKAAQDMQTALKKQALTPEQAQQLGLTPGMHTWGANINPYMTTKALSAADQGGYAQASTPEEFARYNALNQLAGGQNPLQASIFGGATKAGYDPYQFDKAAAQKAIEEKQQAILGPDYQNAIIASLGNFGFTPVYKHPTGNTGAVVGGAINGPAGAALGSFIGSSGGSGMKSSDHELVGDALTNQLAQQVGSGSLNPQQTQDIINQIINMNASAYTGGQGDIWQKPWQQFQDYYNNEYSPAAGATIGAAAPVGTKIPSKIKAL